MVASTANSVSEQREEDKAFEPFALLFSQPWKDFQVVGQNLYDPELQMQVWPDTGEPVCRITGGGWGEEITLHPRMGDPTTLVATEYATAYDGIVLTDQYADWD